MSEFLLAGNEGLHSLWPDTARRSGVLLCNNDHDGECSIKTGCGIGNEAIRYIVMPIISVQGFDCDKFDSVLLVTLSKRNLNADKLFAKSVIRTFLIHLQEQGVAVLESKNLTGQRMWIDFN